MLIVELLGSMVADMTLKGEHAMKERNLAQFTPMLQRREYWCPAM